MVARIMKSTGSMRSPLDYNEHKVGEGDAKVVAMANMDDAPDPLRDTFSRYERGNIRSTEVSFHMSVNPGPGEHLSDGEVRSFVGELMEGLGYGSQPYVIYRHNDIEREHYHVVSIRVDGDGRKIPDYLENRNCLRLLAALSEKYGFTVGNAEVEAREVSVDPERFDPASGGIIRQMEVIGRECCSWRFTSMDQFRLVMRDHGILVSDAPDRSGSLVLKGLDSRGRACTRPVDSRSLSFDLTALCRGRIRECISASRAPVEHLDRVGAAVAACLGEAHGGPGFTEALAGRGIRWECVRDAAGRISGATFLDRRTRSVFNVSELRNVGLRNLRQADAAGAGGGSRTPAEDGGQKQSSFAGDLAGGLSMLGSLLDSMAAGVSAERDMKDRPDTRKGRRR